MENILKEIRDELKKIKKMVEECCNGKIMKPYAEISTETLSTLHDQINSQIGALKEIAPHSPEALQQLHKYLNIKEAMLKELTSRKDILSSRIT